MGFYISLTTVRPLLPLPTSQRWLKHITHSTCNNFLIQRVSEQRPRSGRLLHDLHQLDTRSHVRRILSIRYRGFYVCE